MVQPVTTHGAWADKKAAFFADPRNHLPFTSQKFNKAQIARVYDRFQAGCAVELDLGDHVVSITCMGPSTDGSYTIKAASDTKQNGDPTGPAIETLKLDIDGNCLEGPNWAKGKVVQNFVVQCRR